MPADFLHSHPQFAELIRIVAQERGIDPALVEKDCRMGADTLNIRQFVRQRSVIGLQSALVEMPIRARGLTG